MKIGFFDSGLGGLLILKAVAKELPQYDYEYYGDTANLPYGDRTEEEIFAFTKSGVENLFLRDCVIVIIACNTASAETLRRLQDTMLVGRWAGRRILGVIIPTIETVVESIHSRVALFATTRTIESGKYNRELEKLDSGVFLISEALPTLVPLIEEGKVDVASMYISERTRAMKEAGATAIVLGCTHYCLLKEVVRTVMGEGGGVISQDEIIPKKLADYLSRHPELTSRLSRTGGREIILTKHRPDYDRLVSDFLGGVYLGK